MQIKISIFITLTKLNFYKAFGYNYVWVAQIWVWVSKTHSGPFKPLGQTNLGFGPKFGFGFGPECQLRFSLLELRFFSWKS